MEKQAYISLDEVNSSIRRLGMLKDNTDDAAEQLVCDMLASNMKQLAAQVQKLVENPDFSTMVEQYKQQKEDKQ